MTRRARALTGGILISATLGLGVETAVPAEVLDNLEFFLDFDVLENLEVLETFETEESTATVKRSTTTPTVSVSTEAAK